MSTRDDLFKRVQAQKVDLDEDPFATFAQPSSKSNSSSSLSPSTSATSLSNSSESNISSKPTTPMPVTASAATAPLGKTFGSIGATEVVIEVSANPKTIDMPSDLSMPNKRLSVNKLPKEKSSSSTSRESSVSLKADTTSSHPEVNAIITPTFPSSSNSYSSNYISAKASPSPGPPTQKTASNGGVAPIVITGIAASPAVSPQQPVPQAARMRERDRDQTIEKIPLLSGEAEECILTSSVIHIGKKPFEGTTFISNYRLYFHVSSAASFKQIMAISPAMFSYLNVPLAAILGVEKDRRLSPKDHNIVLHTMTIHCKDIRKLAITLQGKIGGPEDALLDIAIHSICKIAFCNNIRNVFAFSHSLPSEPLSITRVELYDPRKEFDRQGIMSRSNSFLRFSTANSKYTICSSYPKLLVVPSNIDDRFLPSIAAFRAGGRLPVLSWGDKHNGATIWRCSQPKIGLTNNKCEADQKYLDEIARSCSTRRDPLGQIRTTGKSQLYIVDCRPSTSAYANLVAGYGYESQNNCHHATLEFYDIGNIHVMRDSLKGLVNLALSAKADNDDVHFSKQIENSEWLSHVRCVLRAGLETALQIRKGTPVLVHCSHGWDRTAQVCGVAQLFLDSHYRTMEGFKVLVEKEFNSYGHQFFLRSQHLADKQNIQNDQVSPIFLQFLDCVWQILRQYPQYFEFNARYILAIADHIYSCRFGTFLFNEDRDRDKFNCDMCVDLWTYLHYNRRSFLNPLFLDPNDEENLITTHVLIPDKSRLLRGVCIWSDYYFRYSPMNSNSSAPAHLHQFLYQNSRSNPVGSIAVSSFNFFHFDEKQEEQILKLPDFHLWPLVTSDDMWESTCRAQSLGCSQGSASGLAFEGAANRGSNYDKANMADIMQTLVLKNETLDRQQEIILRLSEKLKSLGVSEDEVEEMMNEGEDLGPPSYPNPDSSSTSSTQEEGGKADESDSKNKYLLDDGYDSKSPCSLSALSAFNHDEIPIVTNSGDSPTTSSFSSGGASNICISPSGKTYVIIDDNVGCETEGEFL